MSLLYAPSFSYGQGVDAYTRHTLPIAVRRTSVSRQQSQSIHASISPILPSRHDGARMTKSGARSDELDELAGPASQVRQCYSSFGLSQGRAAEPRVRTQS